MEDLKDLDLIKGVNVCSFKVMVLVNINDVTNDI